MLGQCDFSRLGQNNRLSRRWRTGVAHHLGRPGVLILHVRRGVALQCQHLVPGEHVVALPIGQQVLPLHGSDAHDAGDFTTLGLRQLRTLFSHYLQCTFFGFVEKVRQSNGIA